MVQSIDQALITEFSGMVHHEAQQLDSKLMPYAKVKPMSGDVFAYDGLGRIEARELDGRVNPATFDDIQHNRRKIRRRRFVINLPVDSSDVRGALLDPQGEYAKAMMGGMKRQIDRVIQEAFLADIQTGRDFETTLTAAADGVVTVDATAGLTYEKLLEINQNFMDNDVDYDMGSFLEITGAEHTALMKETELTSGDFSRNYAIDNGRIKTAMGMDLIHFAANVPNPIIDVAGGERSLVAATKGAVCLGMSKEMSIKIQERDDYIETTQVQVVMELGAVRTEGALVQEVTVTA